MNENLVILAGNITRDPELKYTPKGTPVLDFGIAVNRRWRDADGNPKEDTYFGDCRAWGKQAEVISQHFPKGRPIYIKGRLAQEEWIDKTTQAKRRKTLTIVDSFDFCGDTRGGKASGPAPEGSPRRPATTSRDTMDTVFNSEPQGDDIHF